MLLSAQAALVTIVEHITGESGSQARQAIAVCSAPSTVPL
jgi:hypothetical protein